MIIPILKNEFHNIKNQDMKILIYLINLLKILNDYNVMDSINIQDMLIIIILKTLIQKYIFNVILNSTVYI